MAKLLDSVFILVNYFDTQVASIFSESVHENLEFFE